MFFDMPLDELKVYKPQRREPKDFDSFWQHSLDETNKYSIDAIFKEVDFSLKLVKTYDVSFNGYQGQTIKGWLIDPIMPEIHQKPCVVHYIGYGGGRGFPMDWLAYSNAGYTTFVMDTRGQGSSWRNGSTPDFDPTGGSPQIPGFMTKGILSPETYYYHRLISDAVRAVDAAKEHPSVDPNQIILSGGSQGGGLALAVSGLRDDLSVVMADVPFLCHFRRAVEITDQEPYQEISLFCKTHRDQIDKVFNTLSYFDGVNFAARAKAQALFSVGLMDTVCPPSTVFAAYNHYQGPKDIQVWEFNQHEGGDNFQTVEQLKYLSNIFN